MGYSGQPMVTVTNNKNLVGKRRKLFHLPLPQTEYPESSSTSTRREISLYEKDQMKKRRTQLIRSRRKAIVFKNIIAMALLLLAIATLTYIIKL